MKKRKKITDKKKTKQKTKKKNPIVQFHPSVFNDAVLGTRDEGGLRNKSITHWKAEWVCIVPGNYSYLSGQVELSWNVILIYGKGTVQIEEWKLCQAQNK